MKTLFIILITALILLFQVSFSPELKLFGVIPDLFLMFLIPAAFFLNDKLLFSITFSGALFLDLLSSMQFGLLVLPYLLIVLLVLLTAKYIFTNVNFLILIVLALISTIILDIFNFIFLLTAGLKVELIFYLKNLLIPKLAINSVFVVLFYLLINYLGNYSSLIARKSRQ